MSCWEKRDLEMCMVEGSALVVASSSKVVTYQRRTGEKSYERP